MLEVTVALLGQSGAPAPGCRLASPGPIRSMAAFLFLFAAALVLTSPALAKEARVALVESIPRSLDLRVIDGVESTAEVLRRLTDEAEESIDLTAMYWNLLPGGDSEGFSAERLDAFGAGEGRALYEALERAAQRGVRIRILQAQDSRESDDIRAQNRETVSIRAADMKSWYGGGIMHQKFWIFDRHSIYLGSANMDWKSLTQVKEMGIVVERHPVAADDLSRQFDAWWKFAAMPANPVASFDTRSAIERLVPRWSKIVPEAERLDSPFAKFSTGYGWGRPFPFSFDGQEGGAFISAAPRELCPPGRTFDGDGIVRTILDAGERVSVSVMDFAPTSLYRENAQRVSTPVWWPELVDALLSAVVSRGVNVRLLVSRWAHTNRIILPYLEALERTASACLADQDSTCGRLEVRVFQLPGWDRTRGRLREFPGHTRVNHAKYVVTDRRVNIGTSNMTWSYFSSTAGASFNTDQPALVRKLQEVFDRDWGSRYAFPLSAIP